MPASPALSAAQRDELLATLRARFEKHPERHPALDWAAVEARLTRADAKLRTLAQMEATGGEPDVVGADAETGAIIFVDCAMQSPKGRRSLCFDRAAREGRREHPPKGSAMELAEEMGATLLSANDYRRLQTLGDFDTTTSSWVRTPARIRRLGGALFCDKRYDTVFVYHNGADSYYAARGFRCLLRV